MEYFKESNTVRLRSRHGKYLYADDDECGVSQSRNTSGENTVWTVEADVKDTSKLKLKSCYNCYLTAANKRFLTGWTGNQVLQMKLVGSESSVMWEPIKEGFSVKLRAGVRSGFYLRANGSLPPWRNSVTHDDSTHKQDWFSWEVVPVDNTGVSDDEEEPYPDESSPQLDGRIIYYAIAHDNGNIPESFDFEFFYKGHDVKMLVEKMKEESGIHEDIYVCARNHFTNKLFPFLLQLPPNNSPMYVIVVKASSKLAKTLPGVMGVELKQNQAHMCSQKSSQSDL